MESNKSASLIAANHIANEHLTRAIASGNLYIVLTSNETGSMSLVTNWPSSETHVLREVLTEVAASVARRYAN